MSSARVAVLRARMSERPGAILVLYQRTTRFSTSCAPYLFGSAQESLRRCRVDLRELLAGVLPLSRPGPARRSRPPCGGGSPGRPSCPSAYTYGCSGISHVSYSVDRARRGVGSHPGFTVKQAPRDGAIGGEARGVAHHGPCRPGVMPGVEARGGAYMHACTRWLPAGRGARVLNWCLDLKVHVVQYRQVGGASPGPNKAPEVAKVSRWLYPHMYPGRDSCTPGQDLGLVKPGVPVTPGRARQGEARA